MQCTCWLALDFSHDNPSGNSDGEDRLPPDYVDDGLRRISLKAS